MICATLFGVREVNKEKYAQEDKLMNRVCVLGSINMDLVINSKRIPKVGETVLAKDIKKIPGGKGANQAVAAKRLGCEVYMLGKVGTDDNGRILLEALKSDGINLDYILKDDINPTGMAIINVDEEGNNSITVIPGANMTISHEDFDKTAEMIKDSKIVIAQFETPKEITKSAFKFAKECGAITILNPAPASEIDDELLLYTDIIVPNETEVYELTKIEVKDLKTAEAAANKFLEKGVKYVIITLGEKGAALVTKEKSEIVPAYKVDAVDTTAAGDSFIGGLTKKLSECDDINFEKLIEGIKFANKVSSIVVTRKGAQTSLPYLCEVMEIYGEE